MLGFDLFFSFLISFRPEGGVAPSEGSDDGPAAAGGADDAFALDLALAAATEALRSLEIVKGGAGLLPIELLLVWVVLTDAARPVRKD